MGAIQPARTGASSAATQVEDRSERAPRIRAGAFDVAPGVHRLPLPDDSLRAVGTRVVAGDHGPVLIDAGGATRERRVRLATCPAHVGHRFRNGRWVLARHSTEYFSSV
jgi:hypothetical protein